MGPAAQGHIATVGFGLFIILYYLFVCGLARVLFQFELVMCSLATPGSRVRRVMLSECGVSGVLGQIFGGSPFVAVTQQWNGTSWTEVADLSTARDQLGGTGNSTITALAFGGRTPGGAVANTEEWTVPETKSNLTITD